MNRICIFIDGSNFYFALKRNNHSTRVDYHQLSLALAGPDRRLIRAYYYNSAYDQALSPEQWKTQQPFLDSLIRTPFLELRLGKLVPLREGGFREKGADTKLASDLVYYGARGVYDTAVVVTEDADFAHALHQVKELGLHIELGVFPDSQPRELVSSADRTISLTEVFDKFYSKIFPEVTGDEFGNRIGDGPSKKRLPVANTRSGFGNRV